VVGVQSITYSTEGDLLDASRVKIQNVWKTWSWQTAIDQVTSEELTNLLENEEQIESNLIHRDITQQLRLIDVLFHYKLRVFEPIWTLLPTNKAILPIMSKLSHNHPYILNAG